MISIYIILGVSWNLVFGYGGMLSICHAAFYGIGAYVFSLLITHFDFSFIMALLSSVAVTGISAFLIGGISLRLRGDFFFLATLGFQTIIFSFLYNWTELTNGPYGIAGIPRPVILGINIGGIWSYFLLVGGIASVVTWMVWRVTTLPFGRTLQAARDDELAAQSLGKNTQRIKQIAFTLGGLSAAVSGALFAGYTGYIDPTMFTLDESIFIICVVIIGGTGTLSGPIIGSAILVLLPEFLRILDFPNDVAANIRQVIYGLLLIILMRFRSQGILGRYVFD